MKTARSIIAQIKLLPQFKKFDEYYCYNKYVSLLDTRFQRAISFVYIRRDTLFLALSHHGIKWELNSNKDLLKSMLTVLKKREDKCKNLKASKIVLFNVKPKPLDKRHLIDTKIHYKERASGEFNVDIEHEELKRIFEEIKSLIKENSQISR
jgi:hypothetical protein